MDVRLIIDGCRMAVSPTTPEIAAALQPALRYKYVRHLRGREAYLSDRKVEIIPVDCFTYSSGNLVTNAGYRQRVAKLLKAQKHRVIIKRLNQPHPLAFTYTEADLPIDQFRYKQLDVLRHMSKYDRCRFDCFTGYGKSYLFRHILAAFPRSKIDIVTTSADVIRELHQALTVEFPNVGLVGAGGRHVGDRVTLYCAKSLHKSDFRADIVLADEVHELATESYLQSLVSYRHAHMYGFSASHNSRMDQADMELEGLFGPIVLSVKYAEGVKRGMAVPIQVRWIPVIMDYDPCTGYEGTAKERWGIWRNKVRNGVIAETAREFDDDTQVLIVVKTVEHAAFLKKVLPEYTLVYAENGMSAENRHLYKKWKLIPQDEPLMTRQLRLKLKKQFETGKLKKVIATGVWNRGVNFHQLQVLIRADAAGSAIADTQIPGRLSRMHNESGKTHGLLIDLMDQFNVGYRSKAKKRENNYAEKQWTQTHPEARSRFRQQRLL